MKNEQLTETLEQYIARLMQERDEFLLENDESGAYFCEYLLKCVGVDLSA